ncbi:MAG: hypothetical protein ACFE89_04370 [Candidatus Hodarchaeota archaeon]
MTDFLNVAIQNGQFVPLGHEQVATTIDEVRFEGETGRLVVSDVRVVWYKQQKKKGGGLLGGFAKAFAVGVAGSAAAGVARRHGGIIGRAVGHGIQSATDATAKAIVFDSLRGNQLVTRGADGSAESLAIPLIAIDNISSPNDKLIITLNGGDDIEFTSKKEKMFAIVEAQIETAKAKNKCPYCSAHIPNGATHCPNCAAAVRSGTASTPSPVTPATMPTTPGVMPSMPQVQCPHCKNTVAISERCTQCGGTLIAHCPKCNAEYPLFMYQGNFCPKCGAKIG